MKPQLRGFWVLRTLDNEDGLTAKIVDSAFQSPHEIGVGFAIDLGNNAIGKNNLESGYGIAGPAVPRGGIRHTASECEATDAFRRQASESAPGPSDASQGGSI